MSDQYYVKKQLSEASFYQHHGAVLRMLDIELTERCNNNCVHCCINRPMGDVQAMRDEMTTDEIKRILQEAADLGCMRVRFSGGEPLLRGDFKEVYVFARRLGLKVVIFTNATLITEEMAGLWAKMPPLMPIEVSVYGMTQPSCEKITRTPGSFDAAKQGISWLEQYKIPFVVKSIAGFFSEPEMKSFEDWAAGIPWMIHPPEYSMDFSLSARRDEMANARIRKIRLSAQETIRMLARQGESYRRNMQQFCSRFMAPAGEEIFPCGSGCGGCVDAYGKFQPCMGLRHPACVVDLRQETLKSALDGVFAELKKWRSQNPEYLKRCARCFLHGLCGQCPARSWSEYGALDTPVEYRCEIVHAEAVFLGLIGADEKAWEVKDWRERIKVFVNS